MTTAAQFVGTDKAALDHYWRWIAPLREKARELGYALAVHGSIARDIDLVAIPWTEAASPEPELAEALREITGGHFSWSLMGDADFTRKGLPGTRPHGRLGWCINLADGVYIDLAVMPRTLEI